MSTITLSEYVLPTSRNFYKLEDSRTYITYCQLSHLCSFIPARITNICMWEKVCKKLQLRKAGITYLLLCLSKIFINTVITKFFVLQQHNQK